MNESNFEKMREHVLERYSDGKVRQRRIYEDLRATAYIGPGGRVEMVCAPIQPENLDQGTPPTQRMRDNLRKLNALEFDETCHIIASRLGGTGTQAWNIFPQNKTCSRGTWAKAEDLVYNAVQKGNTVSYTVLLEYPSNQATRPTKVWYAWRYRDVTTRVFHSDCGYIINSDEEIMTVPFFLQRRMRRRLAVLKVFRWIGLYDKFS